MLKQRGNWTEVAETQNLAHVNFYWRPVNLSYQQMLHYAARIKSDPRTPIFFNHFDQNKVICTKDGLIKSLTGYYETNESALRAQYSVWDTTPRTFLIERNAMGINEMNQFVAYYREMSSKNYNVERGLPKKHCEQNMWVVKPSSLNRGRKIGIFKHLKNIQDYIFASNSSVRDWVVQKYIEKPLLYNGRKFDIRVWVLVTADFKIYMYRQGYLRTSSGKYTTSDQNNMVHLTNHCFQVNGSNFAQYEEGNTLSYQEF